MRRHTPIIVGLLAFCACAPETPLECDIEEGSSGSSTGELPVGAEGPVRSEGSGGESTGSWGSGDATSDGSSSDESSDGSSDESTDSGEGTSASGDETGTECFLGAGACICDGAPAPGFMCGCAYGTDSICYCEENPYPEPFCD